MSMYNVEYVGSECIIWISGFRKRIDQHSVNIREALTLQGKAITIVLRDYRKRGGAWIRIRHKDID